MYLAKEEREIFLVILFLFLPVVGPPRVAKEAEIMGQRSNIGTQIKNLKEWFENLVLLMKFA